MLVLGIETSCDETAAAIVKDGKEVMASVVFSQIDIHKEYGGVVPEIASRNHVRKITVVMEQAFKKAAISPSEIQAIAVCNRPGLIGSLIVGINAAKTLALVYEKPLIPVNHIHGHIYANYLERGFRFPALALVVSGGHTELILMCDHYDFLILGETQDDAVGETYDKVGRVLGLEYPAGPKMDALAQSGRAVYPLPLVFLDKKQYNFSFSGLKTATLNLINNVEKYNDAIPVADIAASFQKSVVTVLVQKTVSAAKKFAVKQIIVAGGVAANKGLRAAMENEINNMEDIVLSFPSLEYCTDNAAMIAAAGYFKYKYNHIEKDIDF